MPLPRADSASSVQATGASVLTIPAFMVNGNERFIFVGEGSSSPSAQQTLSVVRNSSPTETFTEAWDQLRALNHRNSGSWFVNPRQGSYSITVTLAAVEDECCAGAVGMTEVDQENPVGASTTAQAATGTTGAVTLDCPNNARLICNTYVHATAITALPRTTSLWEQESIGAFGAGGCSIQDDNTVDTLGWTHTSNPWLIGALVVNGSRDRGPMAPQQRF